MFGIIITAVGILLLVSGCREAVRITFLDIHGTHEGKRHAAQIRLVAIMTREIPAGFLLAYGLEKLHVDGLIIAFVGFFLLLPIADELCTKRQMGRSNPQKFIIGKLTNFLQVSLAIPGMILLVWGLLAFATTAHRVNPKLPTPDPLYWQPPHTSDLFK